MSTDLTVSVPVAVDVGFSASIHQSPTIDVAVSVNVSTSIIYNTYPIMGYVYEPIDIQDVGVVVQSDISDYYYVVNDNGITTPTVSWATQPLSQNSTNDTYQPYTLK